MFNCKLSIGIIAYMIHDNFSTTVFDINIYDKHGKCFLTSDDRNNNGKIKTYQITLKRIGKIILFNNGSLHKIKSAKYSVEYKKNNKLKNLHYLIIYHDNFVPVFITTNLMYEYAHYIIFSVAMDDSFSKVKSILFSHTENNIVKIDYDNKGNVVNIFKNNEEVISI